MSRATIQCLICKGRSTVCLGLVVGSLNATHLTVLLKGTCNSRMIKHSNSINGMQGGPESSGTCAHTLYSRRVCQVNSVYYGKQPAAYVFNLSQSHLRSKKVNIQDVKFWILCGSPPGDHHRWSKVPTPPSAGPSRPPPLGQTPQSWLSPVAGREPPLAVNVGHTPCLPHPQPSPA